MIIRKNYTALDTLNNIRLQLIDLGHVTTASEWVGSVKSPMYARLYFIIGGDPYVMINGEKNRLRSATAISSPRGSPSVTPAIPQWSSYISI